MERGKLTLSSNEEEKIPPTIKPWLAELESCDSHEGYTELLSKLEVKSKSDKQLREAFHLVSGQYPTLSDIEPGLVARSIKEHYFDMNKEVKTGTDEAGKTAVICPLEVSALVPSQPINLSLDTDSLQNIKKELRKTYAENNINFLANGTL